MGDATVTVDVPDADAMRRLGARLAALLRAGDLVLLRGPLGAGKTTLVQGVGDGLGVRGPVTSPTFIIARHHPSLTGGPPLLHVDAYRLGSWAELEDLDLEASLDEAVTVVEWGEGFVEGLAPDRLEVGISRPADHANSVRHADDTPDVRTVTISAVGPRWRQADLGFVSSSA
ncbi:MAG: tRNA (adenosine(37)-N6)-threonylcarbamoyltransferase complex ATPase subunit type 1 TsaE [Jiangellaceae bacterium]